MQATKITIQTTVSADPQKAWAYYTEPEHITQWNFASDDWQCPSASNDLRPGGTYRARMEAKDGSFAFDFEATYLEVEPGKHFRYVLGEDRMVDVDFRGQGQQTEVTVAFDAETENPVDMQREGWQAILNNYKNYTESH
ncbi:SRPBCC family protein [Neolewinella lacunae]|uniref:SRPBCC family protein n=1 Tax=Neolewinella lacunae TaxID=1517758 RepID=A0A923T7G5_9BACT|nr:SRPBCC family protein [Neolewinella lacunae]MBC6994480.1 SRPBCC family protein [Neolewinella lacunae]MDN3634173.1 SRPBCC family protein [Neolewinella lacunae]